MQAVLGNEGTVVDLTVSPLGGEKKRHFMHKELIS